MIRNVAKWQARLKWIKDEIPFGQIKQIRNEEGNLHCDNGPAFISPTRCTCYQDGRKHGYDIDIWGSISYYYEGIIIPSKWFLQPQKLKLEEILNHKNTEVKYVGMKLYGYDKLLQSKNVNIIDEDNDRVLFSIKNVFSEPITIVKVTNSTPELDGSYKHYFLSVPPNMASCREAVAWTFRKEVDDYNPVVET